MFAPVVPTLLRGIAHSRLYSSASMQAEAFLESEPSNALIACLSLNRPQARNAISVNLLKQLRECLDVLAIDKRISTVIVRSTTVGSFCAGADLVERRSMTKAQVDQFLVHLRDAFSRLEALPMPVIAAIDGPCLGGGLEMALACDLRVAGHSVQKIGLPETSLAIIPGAGGTQRATRLVGLSKAKDLIFTGRTLTAQQALDCGLVDYVSEPDKSAYDRSLELATMICNNGPLALRAAKKAISRVPETTLESGLDFERSCYEPLLASQDRVEALDAFREKRKPMFKGE
ncbi:ClpP/crotonase [Fistulina hepatica ATCC 64428]|nr:ClpP/crotonase [Fistulina hepatica ATCC 64428]